MMLSPHFCLAASACLPDKPCSRLEPNSSSTCLSDMMCGIDERPGWDRLPRAGAGLLGSFVGFSIGPGWACEVAVACESMVLVSWMVDMLPAFSETMIKGQCSVVVCFGRGFSVKANPCYESTSWRYAISFNN